MFSTAPSLTLDAQNKILRYHVAGDVISTTARGLRAELERVFESAPAGAFEEFEIDLKAARMVDSVGLNFLVWLWRSVSDRGAKLRVLISSPDIDRTFQFTRLSSRLEVDLHS